MQRLCAWQESALACTSALIHTAADTLVDVDVSTFNPLCTVPATPQKLAYTCSVEPPTHVHMEVYTFSMDTHGIGVSHGQASDSGIIEQDCIRNGLPIKYNPIASTGLSPKPHNEAWISFPRKRIALIMFLQRRP
ncbi:hypothetical protein IAQ61_003142 [Plenodomus lingam]|uniref:uncharacterized protein n=1 Tax=Leptosphaeria maculans TaxID=5022 RepID=UPI003330FF92|nr:hypothetical protein IAQ61_003142 [Plenodomus lingam]